MNERDTDEHGFSQIVSVFIRANPCPIFEGGWVGSGWYQFAMPCREVEVKK